VDDVAVLVDALDFTSIHPWTHNNPLRPIQHARLFNAQPYAHNIPLACIPYCSFLLHSAHSS
jgi:hypothetical protein